MSPELITATLAIAYTLEKGSFITQTAHAKQNRRFTVNNLS